MRTHVFNNNSLMKLIGSDEGFAMVKEILSFTNHMESKEIPGNLFGRDISITVDSRVEGKVGYIVKLRNNLLYPIGVSFYKHDFVTREEWIERLYMNEEVVLDDYDFTTGELIYHFSNKRTDFFMNEYDVK